MFDAESIWVVPIAFALGIAILLCEFSRAPPSKGFDLLRVINGLYFVLYVFCPVVLINAPIVDIGSWNYVYQLNLAGRQLVLAELIAFASYLFILIGFSAARRFASPGSLAFMVRARIAGVSNADANHWLFCANVLFGLGVASMIKYTIVIGGFWNLLTWGMLYRSIPMPVDSGWVFLKNLVLITVPASLMYYALAKLRGGFWRWLLFLFSFLAASLALFHHGGRLQLFMFMFTIPIAAALMNRGVRFSHGVAALVVGVVLVFLGKEILFLFYIPDALTRGLDKAVTDVAAVLFRASMEFSFPFISLAKALDYVPYEEGYRWFSDFYWSVVYLMPQRALGTELPRTASDVVKEMVNAPNPADLLTFGYFSLGIPGCFTVAFGFGIASRFVEAALQEPANRMQATLFVSWILFWAFRLMYGDPSQALIGGFHFLLATMMLLAWRRPSPHSRTVFTLSPRLVDKNETDRAANSHSSGHS